MAQTRSEIVSDDSELLILVDEHDVELGTLAKTTCHDGDGVLHRAFSLFVFNPAGELLIQQRATDKRLWPGYWSNSCCSHPRAGEPLALATQRRCQQELGFTTPLQYVYKFQYQADFKGIGAEHELCSVFVGTYAGQTDINRAEISAHRWIAPADLEAEMAAHPEQFTPWFKIEWQTLREEFSDVLPT